MDVGEFEVYISETPFTIKTTKNADRLLLEIGGDRGTILDLEQVRELISALQGWLDQAISGEIPETGEVEKMEVKEEYMPYVKRLNEAMDKMHEGLREIGQITHEMDENAMFGDFRQTLAISEQNFVTGFMLYKTLMVDAVAALTSKR